MKMIWASRKRNGAKPREAMALIQATDPPLPTPMAPPMKTMRAITPMMAQMSETLRTVSKPAAELVQFLAYGGFRKTEANHITWADCDFARGKIFVRGSPETGLKGRLVGESRIVLLGTWNSAKGDKIDGLLHV